MLLHCLLSEEGYALVLLEMPSIKRMVLYLLKHQMHDVMNTALHQAPAEQLLCINLNGDCFLSSSQNI